jgi:hypothetical protein
VIDPVSRAARLTWVRFPSPAPLPARLRRRQPTPVRVSRASDALIARASQAFILSRVGCCSQMPALVPHAGDGCSCPIATGSRSSKRTFGTGYDRPQPAIDLPQRYVGNEPIADVGVGLEMLTYSQSLAFTRELTPQHPTRRAIYATALHSAVMPLEFHPILGAIVVGMPEALA